MKDLIVVDSKTRQLKGNVHMHSTRSDGALPPDVAVDNYRKAGYDFVMLSDHEIYFNSDVYDKPGFLVLGGTETSVKMNDECRWIIDYRKRAGEERAQHKHMHFNCIMDYSSPGEKPYFETDYIVPRMQDRGIDSWNAHVEEMKKHGNIVIVNHPHWSRLEPAHLLATQGCVAVEIWNTGDVHKCGGRSDEDIWDYCLNNGKRILAVAADDSHAQTTDFGKGFIMVCTDDFSKKGICIAIKKGDFYASNGPLMQDMRIENGVLKMKFTPSREVVIAGYDCDGYNIGPVEDGSLLTCAEWRIDAALRWFRVMLKDAIGRTAWMQPIFIEEIVS